MSEIFLILSHDIKPLCCRSCPAAVCSRRPLCSCTVRTWCLQMPSWSSVRGRRVTATRGTAKTVTAPSCWSTPALATRTGCFSTGGWRRASAVRSARRASARGVLKVSSKDFPCDDYLCVCSVPKCPIGMKYSECTKSCSTTCHSLNIQEVCKDECVDGCTCPGNPKRPASRPLRLFVCLSVCLSCMLL